MKYFQIKNLPRKSASWLLICTAVAMSFYILAIYPCQKSLEVLDVKIIKLESRMKKMKSIAPLYKTLIKKCDTPTSDSLPLPEKKKLSKYDVDTIPLILKKIVDESSMKTISITPDVTTLASNPDFILMNTIIRGDFFSFQKFLIGLGKLSFLDQIEEIQIQHGVMDKQFDLKVRLAVE